METPSDCGDIAKSKEECLVKVNTLTNNNLIIIYIDNPNK